MNRRDFLAGSLFAAGTLASRSGFAAVEGDLPAVTVTVREDHPLAAIAPDFLGLGYEISSVARPGLLSPANAVYVQLVRTLGAHGVIRIGGNTADYASYSAAASAISTPYGSRVNDAVLKDLGGFLEATGWQLIWVLNLGSGSVTDAIAEAGVVERAVGKRLLAFEIGNEPDLFVHEKHRKPDYNYEAWLADYRRYKAALRARFKHIAFAGPDVAGSTDWVTRFAADEGSDAALLTHHYYRGGQSSPSSTMGELLGPDPKLQPELDLLRAASQRCGKPYRICEVNSFSGGGRPGVSNTMGSALWALDYMFTLAANGCSGVNMETGVNQLGFISSYSPIGDDEHDLYSASPEYYGLLAFSIAAQGHLVQTTSDGDSSGIKAYAAQPREGPISITLINKTANNTGVSVNLDQHPEDSRATLIRLLAPNVDAKTGITLGGAQVTPAGMWKMAKAESLTLRAGQSRVRLPAFSAVILQVH